MGAECYIDAHQVDDKGDERHDEDQNRSLKTHFGTLCGIHLEQSSVNSMAISAHSHRVSLDTFKSGLTCFEEDHAAACPV